MFLEKIHEVDFRPLMSLNVLMKCLCSYVLALANILHFLFCSRQGAKSRGLQARAPSGRQTPV